MCVASFHIVIKFVQSNLVLKNYISFLTIIVNISFHILSPLINYTVDVVYVTPQTSSNDKIMQNVPIQKKYVFGQRK